MKFHERFPAGNSIFEIMKNKIVVVVITCLCIFFGNAQSVKQILVKDTSGKPIANAMLVNAASTVELFKFVSTENGELFLTETALKMKGWKLIAANFDTLFIDSLSKINELVMTQTKVEETNTILISKDNNFVQYTGEKLIVNVEKMANIGGATLFDLLMRTPNVIINEQNNTVQLRGKSNVVLMMDGRLRQLSGAELIQICKNTPASGVDKIELILNPSAKYDAAGKAGIINIVFKKDKSMGWNLVLSTGIGKGWYLKQNDGIGFTYRKRKIFFQSSLNYNYHKAFNKLDLVRQFYKKDTLLGGYDQNNFLLMPYNIGNYRGGIDYFINNKTTVGVMVSTNVNKFNPNGDNTSRVLNNLGAPESYFTTNNNSHDLWHSYAINGNLKRVTDTFGSEYTLDLDYAKYGNKTDQLFTSVYYNLLNQKIKPDYLLFGDIKGDLNIKAIKFDYSYKKIKNKQFDLGFKSSLVEANNDMKYFDKSNGTAVMDSSKSNHFIYSENINAAYVNLSVTKATYSYQFGLRGENTIAKGNQIYTGETFKRNYLQIFPSFNLQKKINQNHILTFAATRRIDRPTYQQLNPFKFYLDPTTYKAGNPYLRPQLTWNTEITHIYKSALITSFSAGRTFKNITEVIYPSEQDARVTIQTDKNLTDYSEMYINSIYQYRFFKRWSGNINVLCYYGFYRGNLVNTNLNKGMLGLNVNTAQNFYLNQNWSLDANAMYIPRQLYGFMYIKPVFQLGTGISHSFCKKKANLKLNVSDIFFTQNPRGNTEFVNYKESFVVKRESRIVMLTFTYRAGQAGLQSKKRASGAEEEKKRAGNNGLG